jgi:RNA polymerase sigma-70 factor (ECF subfamily)
MLSDSDSANDIVQETFLRLWTRADSYNSYTARLTTWLHNIAHNLCVDSFRRQARISYSDRDDLEMPVSGPGDSYQHTQRAAQVRAALQALPERQRSALLLCHYQGLSNRDAATVLDVSVDALESLLARARRRLKKELQIDDES